MIKSQELLSNKINVFANNLLDFLHKSYPNSIEQGIKGSSIYRSVELCPDVFIRFRKWNKDKKPYFLILYRGNKYIMEFDLSRVIFKSDSKIRWILNRPSRNENKQNLKDLNYSYENQDEADIDTIHKQMKLINGTANRTNKGYKFCIDEDIKIVQDNFKALIDYTIRSNQARDIITIDDDVVDIEAFEGQIREGRYLSKKRNRNIVVKRKEIDDYTCKACNFRLKVDGKYVIECHHLFPLKGEIITAIEDLSCLCPTCHRIAHKRKPPFSINEIRRMLKKTRITNANHASAPVPPA